MRDRFASHLSIVTSQRSAVIRRLSLSLISIALLGLALISASGTLAQGGSTATTIPASKEQSSQSITAPNVMALAAGFSHTCALIDAGEVFCWGDGRFGLLGPDVDSLSPRPRIISGLGAAVVAIGAGKMHTCTALMGGGVKCWGYNGSGALGDGTTTDRSTPVEVVGLSDSIIDLAGGDGHTCAVTIGGGVKCWGWNSRGELGDGTTTPSSTPKDVVGLSFGVTRLAAARWSTCAIQAGGVKCWGIGYGTTPVAINGLSSGVVALAVGAENTACAALASGGAKCWAGTNTPTDVSGLTGVVTQLTLGRVHTCAALNSGGVKCWGVNAEGQLGDGTTDTHSLPVSVSGISSPIAALTSGWYHTCAALTTGDVKCWGENEVGQLGDGTTIYPSGIVKAVQAGRDVAALALGESHSCALSTGGAVRCWGGRYGSAAVNITGLSGPAVTIGSGYRHTCAVIDTGTVQCWGDNDEGQLGDGSGSVGGTTPVTVTGLISNVSALTGGWVHSCALTNSDGVKCWGNNFWAQLGDGTFNGHPTPVDVNGLTSGVKAVAAGRLHTCALLTNDVVKCWGNNGFGQSGSSTCGDFCMTPVEVNGLGGTVAVIAAGGHGTCALMIDGEVKCWGEGSGSTPLTVEHGGGSITAIAMGLDHICLLTSTGGAKCWGQGYGFPPVDVAGLSGATALSAGVAHNCALASNGVWCWGNNKFGQLGDGAYYIRTSPVNVLWSAAYTATAITSAGGTLISPVDHTTYTFLPGTFTDTVTVTHAIPFPENVPLVFDRINIGHVFEVTAVFSDTGLSATPALPYTVTIQYADLERRTAIENTLALYRWEGDHWSKEPSSVVDPISKTVTARPDRLGLWAVLGETYRLYAPVLIRFNQPGFAQRLTFDPANDTEPALSSDGQTVVFISDRAGQTDVFRAPVTGGPATNLTQTPLAQEDTPVFSPDGAQIAFASNRSGDWDIYLMDADGSNVRRTIGYTGTDELQPFFTPDGTALLFSNNVISGNWDIYSATLDSDAAAWTRLTTNPTPDRFPSISADGQTIAFRSERDGNSEIYAMNADGSNVRRLTHDPAFDGYPAIVPDGSGVVFTSQRSGASQVYAMNLGGSGLITMTTRSGWTADMPRLSRDGRQLIYAARSLTGTFDVYLQPYDSPLTQIGARGALSMMGRCDWEAGTLALGLAHAYRTTGNIDDLARLRTWINNCIPIKSDHIDQVNDGLLGYAALIAYQADHQPQQLAFAQQVADFFMNTAQRAPDGTLLHLQGQTLIWDDTLLGAVPFLTEMNKVSGNSLYLDEAISQTIRHANYLRDPGNGLYHHAAYMTGTLYAPTYWARGNGWALLADVELLAAMPITHPQQATILNYFQQQATALKPLQDAGGLWHTVVNRPDFYLESSGSALIGYALRRGVRSGWLDAAQYASTAQASLSGVWRAIGADGLVGGVSGPTGPMIYEDWYNLIGVGQLQLYGQGVALLLASPLSP